MNSISTVEAIRDLRKIGRCVPHEVYDELFNLFMRNVSEESFYFLTRIVEIIDYKITSFQYMLTPNDDENTRTPVLEMFDLLDGYIFYTEFSWTKEQFPIWTVYAL